MVSIIALFPALLFSILLVIASGLKTYFDFKVKEVGEDFIAGCTDDNYTISWRGPRGPLNSTTEPSVEVLPPPHHVALIHFKNPGLKDGGNYTCSTEFDTKVVWVLFKVPLTFDDTKQVQTLQEYGNGVLRCEVTGGIKPTISWYVRGVEAKPPKYKPLGDGLMIDNMTAKDSGQYTCKATESITGDIKERNITLMVEHQPYARDGTVWTDWESAWGFLGSTVNLSCEAIALPAPMFKWRLPNKTGVKIFNDTYSSVLQVNITDETVFTNYSCTVSNKFGSLSKTFQLGQGEQPLPPELVDLQGENSNLLVIGIEAPNNPKGLMTPIGFVVQYRRVDPKKPHGTEWKQQYFNISEKYILRNLEANSKYEVKVATKNIAGLSDYTNSSLFFTLESASGSTTLVGIGILYDVLLSFAVMSLFNW